MTPERAEELFLYAAGSLEPDERVELEADLLTDAATRAALEVERDRLAELALSLDPETPPPAARARLLTRVTAEPTPAIAAPPDVPSAGRGTRTSALATAAVVALLSAASTWGYLDQRVVAPLEQRSDEAIRALGEATLARDELAEALSEQDRERADLETALEQAQEQIELLRSPDLQSVALRGSGSQPDAQARVFWEWEDYTCYLYARNLKAPRPDHFFALWLYNARGDVVGAGTFTPNARGEAALFAKLPRDTGRVVRSLVTEEPLELGEHPTGAVILASRESLL